MKTSKIKEVVNVSEPYGKFKTLYHNLVMDNGDKINIGKVKEQIVGWELTYEIVEEGQQEFNKAKAVQKEYPSNFNTQSKPSAPAASDKMSKQDWADKDEAKEISIVRQSSLKAAVEFCNKDCTVEHLIDNAELFYNWVRTGVKPEATKDERPF